MLTVVEGSEPLLPRIDPLYRPARDGTVALLYTGDLELRMDSVQLVVDGQLELTLAPTPTLVAHVAGSLADLHLPVLGDSIPIVTVPPGRFLGPPAESALPEQPEDDASFPVNHLEVGNTGEARRFLIHISGAIGDRLPIVQVEGGTQRRLNFSLPGWDLVLAVVDQPAGGNEFPFVVEAVASSSSGTATEISDLRNRLFMLLSLVACREVGVGPICGLDATNEVVWAEWGAPRFRPGDSGVRWCPEALVADAILGLSQGMAALTADAALERVLNRAIEHLLSAGGGEVLDVRIPVACSGLELLSWALLQRHGWLASDSLGKISAAAKVRLLIQWAGIPTAIPDAFEALVARKGRIGQPDWEGPEVLFNVRNALVHPPKRLDEPEWPTSDELLESWQIATWYLELVVLRVLGYRGQYWSRLRLGRWASEVEPVPWAIDVLPERSQ